MRVKISVICIALFFIWLSPSHASSGGHPLAKVDFSQDADSLQRGALVYYNVCRVCHAMKYLRYKSFVDIGMDVTKVNQLRGDSPMNMTLVKTISDDVLKELYGMVPPDLSAMAKARKGGPHYIYTLLESYNEKEGVYDNDFFPGIKMPDIMDISTAADDTEREEKIRDIKDVSEFLLWASDPHAAERKTIGFYVVLYFIILSLLLYMIMKRVWSRLDD